MADQSVHPAIAPGPEEIKFVINGRDVVGHKGETIINVAAREGVYIPHYCWHPALSVAGNCRLCLVEVHMPNPRNENKPAPLPKPVIACQTPIAPGMHVFTDSKLAKECQNGMMEFLLVNHPLDCPICDRGGECMLQRYSMEYGQGHSRMVDQKRKFIKPDADPLIDIERNRCIMCTRCVRFCDEVAGDHVMGVFARGSDNYIGTFGQGPVANILSGNVIDMCPVGCLTSKPFRFKARVWELLQTQSTSIWDASGPKVTHWTRNRKLYRTTPPSRKYHDTYTVNEDTEEFIDNLARFGSDFGFHESRWDESRVLFGATLLPAAFTEAVRATAAGLAKVRKSHGAHAIAVVVSPRATMEEGYLAAKLARTVIGTDNVDWRMSFQTVAAAEAIEEAIAHADGDLEDGFDCLILVNGDYLHSVPTFALRLHEHARLYGKPVVQIGHHHDAYLAPTSDWKFHCAPGNTARVLGLLAEAVKGVAAAQAELATLLSAKAERVAALVELLKRDVRKGLIVQSLEDMNGALLPTEVPAALALKDALPAGWKYIPTLRDRNAFGLYAVGAQPGRLPATPEKVRKAWGLKETTPIPTSGGINARGLVEAIEAGRIKAVLALGADVLYSYPDREAMLAALDKLEFFAISDLFDSPITRKADVFLAAASNLERDGTFMDLEGNLARLADTEGPQGGSRPDWEALTGIANMMGANNFNYESVEDVFTEMMGLIAPNFSGTFAGLMLEGPRNDHSVADPGGARKRTKDYNPGNYRTDGAHFRWSAPIATVPLAPAGAVAAEGMVVAWGDHVQGDDYHLNRASIANLLRKPAYVELNPADAERLGVEDHDTVRVDFDGQSVEATAVVRSGPAPGVVYLPAGLGDYSFGGQSTALPATVELVAKSSASAAGELAGVH
jgi:NADH-quinone oxidoreductase subunit G